MQTMVKKAQMKIQQMVFMLLAVTLFFVLAGLFILAIQFSNLRESASVLEERNALLLSTKLANSPEFSCGEAFGQSMSNCIDADKVMVLKGNIQKYSGFWDVDNLEIRTIYPSGEVECTSSNYPQCNIIKLKQGQITSEFSNFVSLCKKENIDGKTQNKCWVAKLMISYGNKTR